MISVLNKSRFTAFFNALKEHGTVVAPVKTTEDIYSFKPISDPSEASLLYTRTMIPPKKYFIKPDEAIFTFKKDPGYFTEPNGIYEKYVLLGVHACDINAMNLLGKVFLEELPDKYYHERRKNSVIVGISCTPDEYCFCKSTGTSTAEEGFDIFLYDIGEKYLVTTGSLKGYSIIEASKDIFDTAEESDIQSYREAEKIRLNSFTKELEMNGLQEMLDLSYESPIWKEYGDKCLSCGSCNMVCPRCRCYDVQDFMNLDMNTGERRRKWYSCMLKDHGLVAGGHNFRPTSAERIRNRFNCKGSLREDMPNCVGCGRCSRFCPAEIDFVEVMNKVRSELNE
jgi:sulfhydrogenase subunit beta (sulfur reductase)